MTGAPLSGFNRYTVAGKSPLTGADHLEAQHEPPFSSEGPPLAQLEPLGILEPVDTQSLGPKEIRTFSILQRVWSLYNCLGICDWVAAPLFALTFPRLVEAVKAITGWDTSLWELLRAGERAQVMARVFNIREGITAKQDALFSRLHSPLPEGPLKGKSIEAGDFQKSLGRYYEMAGWNQEGEPTAGKLMDLGLEWLIDE